LSRDGGNGEFATAIRVLPQVSHPVNDRSLGRVVSKRLHALDALAASAFPLPSGPELQHQNVLLELGNGSENLPNQPAGRIVAAGQINAVTRKDSGSELRELPNNDFLNHQVSRDSIRSLYNDNSDAI
jgi:hypothetical protein